MVELLVVWDAVAITVSGAVSALACERWMLIEGSAARCFPIALLAGPATLALARQRPGGQFSPVIRPLLEAGRPVLMLACLLWALMIVTGGLELIPQPWAAAWLGTAYVLTVSTRAVLLRPYRELHERGQFAERIAIVGIGPAVEQLQRRIRQHYRQTAAVVGAFDTADGHALTKLLELGCRNAIDRIIVTTPVTEGPHFDDLIDRLKVLDTEVVYCPAVPVPGRPGDAAELRIRAVAGLPALVLSNRPISRWGGFAKSAADRLLAAAVIAVLLPLLVVLAVAIALDSPGPVIFRQYRFGFRGRTFPILKFRTMVWTDADEASLTGARQASRGDQRVTRLGGWLRRTSLDELPQLINVLNGSMSLVGPRPHPIAMRTDALLGEQIVSAYPHRYRVKPGITGWAQVNGHRGPTSSAEQIRQRVAHDLYYIDNWSLLFDVSILLRTPFAMLRYRQNAF